MEEIKYNRLKAVLAEKDRTSRWLYEKLGVSKITVSRWVRNDRQPSIEKLYEIAESLNVEVSDLLLSVDNIIEQREKKEEDTSE